MGTKKAARKNRAAATAATAAVPNHSAAAAMEPLGNSATRKETTMALNLTRVTKPRKGSGIVYTLGDLRATVRFPRSAFAGEPPSTLVIEGDGFAQPGVAKAKMTKEERAALRANLTPADKARIARERAEKAAARAAKLEAAAAANPV